VAADLLPEAVADQTAERGDLLQAVAARPPVKMAAPADLLLAAAPADKAEAARLQNRSRPRKSAWSAPGSTKAPSNRSRKNSRECERLD